MDEDDMLDSRKVEREKGGDVKERPIW